MKRRTKKPPAEVSGARWVALTKGKFALVDDSDYEAVTAAGPWHLYTPSRGRGRRRRQTHYARKVFYDCNPHGFTSKRRSMYLHRWLWERWRLPPTEHVDHVDGDGLDCRREKLRAATHAENQRNRVTKNSTGYCGVTRDGKRFIARISYDGGRHMLGRFSTAEEAAATYDSHARAMHGRFAKLNFGGA